MTDYADIITRYGLRPVRTLQETDFKKVDLVETKAHGLAVLKFCKQACPSLKLETEVLKATQSYSFQNLEFPKHIASDADFLLMSYVAREDQTRDTILNRDWSDKDIKILCDGMNEFQTLHLPKSAYSLKQRLMGVCYPAVKMMLSLPALARRSVLSPSQILKLSGLSTLYILQRPRVNYVTTHYDMTTLNCAFSESGKLSILDLELGYALGDPLFDMCYFLTIPPQSLQNWTFQRTALKYFYSAHVRFAAHSRLRFILLVCSIGRLLHFKSDTKEHAAYKQSIGLLLNKTAFSNWWDKIEVVAS